jgi:FkbM family methyltransferase
VIRREGLRSFLRRVLVEVRGAWIEIRGNWGLLHGVYIPLDSLADSRKARAELAAKGHGFEDDEVELVRSYLDPELAVIELGGCVGLVAAVTNRMLSNPDQHVVVEANPGLLPALERTRARNRCKFKVVHAAVGYGGPTAELFLSDRIMSSSVVRPELGRSIVVPSRTLRDIADTANFRAFTLICDIEGAEFAILAQDGLLLSERAHTIIMEIHENVQGCMGATEALRILSSLGFERVALRGRTWVLRSTRLPLEPRLPAASA